MALDNSVVFVLILLLVLVPITVIYLIYRLAKFLIKVNKFIDEQTKKQKEQESPSQKPTQFTKNERC